MTIPVIFNVPNIAGKKFRHVSRRLIAAHPIAPAAPTPALSVTEATPE
jgi:hypothetical protein